MTKTLPYDSAEFLSTPEIIAAYIEEAFASHDSALISHALGAVARAKSMTEIARKTGLSRESLYRALSAEGRPELSTIMKVMDALGLRLTAQPASQPKAIPVKRFVKKPVRSMRRTSGKRLAVG